jgi:hypothetical protein
MLFTFTIIIITIIIVPITRQELGKPTRIASN